MLALCLPPPQGQLLRAVGEEAQDLDMPIDWSLDIVETKILGAFGGVFFGGQGCCILACKGVKFLLASLANKKRQDMRA